MKTTRKGWMVAFISPDVLELMRDFIMSGKGDSFKITKPDWLPQYAVEEFLYHHGYAHQVHEVRVRRRENNGNGEKSPGMDHLNPEQRKTVLILMEHRGLTEQQAIKWTVEHPDEIERALH